MTAPLARTDRPPRRRRLALALLLTLALSATMAVWDAAEPDAGVAQPVAPPRPAVQAVAPAPAMLHDGPAPSVTAPAPWPPVPRQALLAWGPLAAADPAAPAAPRQAPSPRTAPPPPAPAPAEVAPPAPFRYTGRITQDGLRRALLIGPQGTLVVAEQEALAGQWRVDRIADDALLLTWLPGSLPQRLPFAPT